MSHQFFSEDRALVELPAFVSDFLDDLSNYASVFEVFRVAVLVIVDFVRI